MKVQWLKVLFVFMLFVSLTGCTGGDNDGALDYEQGYARGYEAGEATGYSSGYDEGFQYAANFILDRMDPEYREQWWEANIEEIMEIGLEY